MIPNGSVAITADDDHVLLTVHCGSLPVTVVLASGQARELALMIRNAADFVDASGQPHGHA